MVSLSLFLSRSLYIYIYGGRPKSQILRFSDPTIVFSNAPEEKLHILHGIMYAMRILPKSKVASVNATLAFVTLVAMQN